MRIRRLASVLLATFVGAFLVAVPAQGATVTQTIGEYTYQVNDADVENGATILSSTFSGTELIVPGSVDIAGTTYVVTQIYSYVFDNLGLTSVVIPEGVEMIQPYAFAHNDLTSVTLPASVWWVNTGAFSYNEISSVTLPEGLRTVGPGVFAYNALTSVTIPATVTTISSNAFSFNPALTTFTFTGNAPYLTTNTAALGTSGATVRFYEDSTGFTTPTWTGGGNTTYASQMIPLADVTFDANGHGTAPAQASVRPGNTVSDPGDLTATGYTFNGWFTAATDGTQVTLPYTANGDATLYAQWSPVMHTVTLHTQNGVEETVFEVQHGSGMVTGDAIRTGYTFTGWWDAASGGTQFIFPVEIVSDFTAWAQWDANEYTVTFEPGNGSTATAQNADYDTTVVAPDAPTRANYAFTGWFTAASGGTQVTFPYTVSGDVTLYAQWAIDSHVVTFEPGNGSSPLTETVNYNDTVSAPPAPSREGHTFTGWFTAASGGTQVTFPYTVTTPITFYAQWDVNEYAITFEPGNGDSVSSELADYGTTAGSPTPPSRVSYAFLGWFTAASGGTQVTFPYTVSGNATLYTQWELMPASISAPAQAAAGSSITVSGENFIPGETVEVWLLSTPVLLTTAVVGSDGTFAVNVMIPANVSTGAHSVEVRGTQTITLASPITVTEALAATGASIGGMGWATLALLLGGAALLVLKRRLAVVTRLA